MPKIYFPPNPSIWVAHSLSAKSHISEWIHIMRRPDKNVDKKDKINFLCNTECGNYSCRKVTLTRNQCTAGEITVIIKLHFWSTENSWLTESLLVAMVFGPVKLPSVCVKIFILLVMTLMQRVTVINCQDQTEDDKARLLGKRAKKTRLLLIKIHEWTKWAGFRS